MATGKSGSFAVTTSNRYISGTVSWSETYDILNNASVVTASLRLSRTNTGYETYGSGNFTLSINGNSTTDTGVYSLTYNSNTLCVEHSVTVPHNEDGSKTITISASGVIYSGSPNMTLSEQGASIALTTIPRASTMTAQNGSIGSTIRLTVNRASSSFTHTITWSAGGRTGSFKNVGDSYDWEVSDYEICRGNTEGKTIPCTFAITTYNGNTKIGNTQSASCTLTIPENEMTRPAVTVSAVTRGGNAPADWGVYVRNNSTASITVESAAAQFDAEISRCTIEFSTGARADGAQMTAECSQAGTHRFTVTVYDTRGISTVVTSEEITVEEYASPVISSATRSRCNSDGTLSTAGTYLKVNCGYSFSEVGSNEVTRAEVLYRVSGSNSDYYQLGDFTNGEDTIIGGGGVAINNSYDIRFVIEDTLGNTDYYDMSVATAECILNINTAGNGMGVGKYAEEENLLDVNWEVRFRKPITIDGVSLLDYFFPINSILPRYDHISPASLCGGSWERLENTFLYGAAESATIGATGGESTHTLTTEEMPNHSHDMAFSAHDNGVQSPYRYIVISASTTGDTNGKGWRNNMGTFAVGGGAAHNNMPPYTNISYWRRVE